MKRISTVLAVALMFVSVTGASLAADIASIPWTSGNAATLRSLDKTGLVKLLNEMWPGSFTSAEVGQFEWADLAGNGQYRLVLTLSGPCAHFVGIYSRDASGRLSITQRLEGFANLRTGIGDLNGDGKDELVILRPLVRFSCVDNVAWPAIYRFEKGKYVEASRDFPSYYDDKVLPGINAAISRYEAKNEEPSGMRMYSASVMVRDKILRVLGRDPEAGLQQAYQWLNSNDPVLLQCAAVTFKDIGGHQKEVTAAKASYVRVQCRRDPGLAMCKSGTVHWLR